jgi:hypothetical protein
MGLRIGKRLHARISLPVIDTGEIYDGNANRTRRTHDLRRRTIKSWKDRPEYFVTTYHLAECSLEHLVLEDAANAKD